MKIIVKMAALLLPTLFAVSCAPAHMPDGRSVSIPTVTPPVDRYKGLNEERDPITRVKLGRDVLVPQRTAQDPLPRDDVGPFELRGETLASALQLALDDYDITLAFESDKAMTSRISVSNLRGEVGKVVEKMCSLSDLYCSYKDHVLTVKDTETFVVDLPPLAVSSSGGSSTGESSTSSTSSTAEDSDPYTQISNGLKAIIGSDATVDKSTRVMIYTTTQRAQQTAEKYFERLRKNTAVIVYETHIWEVTLNNENRTGIDWSLLIGKAITGGTGNFGLKLALPGVIPNGAGTPITITPSYTGSNLLRPSAVLKFIAQHGTVKTVSQPQLTVLSGSTATLEVQQAQNFVSGVQRTPSTTAGVPDTVSTTTQTVQTGLTMTVNSAWDQSTVYGAVKISINDLLAIDQFQPDENTTIQLPKTTKRGLQTQVRVRPGDAILIGGLVTEKDNYAASGPGFMKPFFASERQTSTANTELVFLLRPRVVAFIPSDASDTPDAVDAPSEDHAFVRRPPARNTDITQEVDGLFPASMSEVKKEETIEEDVVEADKAISTLETSLQKKDEKAPSPLPEGLSPLALVPKATEETNDHQQEGAGK